MIQPALTRYPASELPVIDLPAYSAREWRKKRETTIFSSLSNVEQRLSFWQFSPQSWTIHVPAFTVAQMKAFWVFFDQQDGERKPFKWVNVVDSVLYYVRFGTKEPKFVQTLPLRFSGSFVLRQVSDIEINELG